MQGGGTNYNSRNVNLDLLKSDTPLLPQIGGGATNGTNYVDNSSDNRSKTSNRIGSSEGPRNMQPRLALQTRIDLSSLDPSIAYMNDGVE